MIMIMNKFNAPTNKRYCMGLCVVLCYVVLCYSFFTTLVGPSVHVVIIIPYYSHPHLHPHLHPHSHSHSHSHLFTYLFYNPIIPFHISSRLISSRLISSHLISPPLQSHHTFSYPISSHLISSPLILSNYLPTYLYYPYCKYFTTFKLNFVTVCILRLETPVDFS